MCTVTFFPLAKKNNAWVLTSNRDEQKMRPTLSPEIYVHKDRELIYPKDQQAGGTWIACSNKGTAACLLNGAFEAHVPQPPYRQSRGLVPIHALEATSFASFCAQYLLEGIEPFTLIFIEKNDLYELRWNGEERFWRKLDAQQAYIWSSATLYAAAVRQAREQLFASFVAQNATINPDLMECFHTFGKVGSETNDLVMQRNSLQTLSISQIVFDENEMAFGYKDLIHQRKSCVSFDHVRTKMD
ncbi:MAG: NRDE family protein [Chitinophagales bacterium]|nr:NRDE family protein [Bacteroidota bacterium]MCB9042165.1 NRDE family protein [Chitinophagales bacterium]